MWLWVIYICFLGLSFLTCKLRGLDGNSFQNMPDYNNYQTYLLKISRHFSKVGFSLGYYVMDFTT